MPLKISENTFVQKVDLNNDGYKDIATMDVLGKFKAYLWNESDKAFETNPSFVIQNWNDKATLMFSSTINGCKWLDWNADGRLDLMLLNESGKLNYYQNMSNKNTLEMLPLQNLGQFDKASGLDIYDINNDNLPDLLLGNEDGSIQYALAKEGFNASDILWELPEKIDVAVPENVSKKVFPMAISLNKKQFPDIIVGNEDGIAFHLKAIGNTEYILNGVLNVGGDSLLSDKAIIPSLVINSSKQNPDILWSSIFGKVKLSSISMKGDFDKTGGSENKVEIGDFQLFGDQWNSGSSVSNWKPEFNLNLTPDKSGVQAIDIMDFADFGDSWTGND